MTTKTKQIISLLNIENRNQINEMINETIQSYKDDKNDAGEKLDYLFKSLKLEGLDEQSQNEVKNSLLFSLKSDAGYYLKEDYLWNVGGNLAPLRETTATGLSIVGPDSPKIGNINKRQKGSDGLMRQKPMPKPQDKDEKEIEDKLQALLKLFNSRSKTKITMTSLKKILSDASIEERSSIKQKMNTIDRLINEDEKMKDELIQHYFIDGAILEDSASSTSSSTSWSNWNAVEHAVYIDSTGRVKSSNTFLVRVAERVDQQKLEYLLSKGVTVIEIEADGTEIEIKNKPAWLSSGTNR